ncbi:MAG: N-formylglutamate amidohydrolase [Rhizobiaceae bacterium]|nr:N-formylglutamate amidohydrolase [Rhizobiaceae bacterium]
MSEQTGILAAAEGMAVTVENAGGVSPVLLVCEHASLRMPAALGTLGLAPEALSAHIAWDPGALAVARRLSGALDATLIFQNFSRLAYDCNRPPESPDAMPAVSEVYEIPGNRDIDPAQRQARIDGIYRPWRRGLADLIAARKAAGRETAIVTVHTFTPVYKGQPRTVEIGILHDGDTRLADAMLARAERAGQGYRIERNAPYGPADGVTHTLVEHGLSNGLLNAMIEIRNDLVRDESGLARISDLLETLVSGSLSDEKTRGNARADATS